MKQKHFKMLATLGLLSLLFAGCEKGPEAARPGTVTFSLSVPELELATKTPGSSGENGSESDRFGFYQFNDANLLEKSYFVDYSELSPSADNTLDYTITFDAEYTGVKNFVILRASKDIALPKVRVGFPMAGLLDARYECPGDKQPLPNIMSCVSAEGKPFVSVESSEKNVDVAVSLARRVARFDIVNDMAKTGLEINKVYIQHARKSVYYAQVPALTDDFYPQVIEIPSKELANGGKSFYLYPTELSDDEYQGTVIWATTRIKGKETEGPELRIHMTSSVRIEANHIYELTTENVDGFGSFDIIVRDWEDGNSMDWFPLAGGMELMDDKAQLIEGTTIKGKYVKIPMDATFPYTIKIVTVDDKETAGSAVAYDGKLPSWLTIKATDALAGPGFYRHEILYTVSKPASRNCFAITYRNGSREDSDMVNIGFIDPYPGTPLPCLSYKDQYYAPVQVNQSTYLKNNSTDKAFYAGDKTYTLFTQQSFVHDKAVNPCPEGWRTLNNAEAKILIKCIGDHLSKDFSDFTYVFPWLENPDGNTELRVLGGYPKKGTTTKEDVAFFGDWPYITWAKIRGTRCLDYTVDNQWKVSSSYAIPYRCIRSAEGWN